MSLRDSLLLVHKIFLDHGIAHALIGGMGLAAIGIHRATNDVDFLVRGDQKALIKTVLKNAQWKLVFETEEVMHWEGKGQLDLLIARRPLSLEMLRQATNSKVLGIPCVSPEAIIGLKIQAYTNDKKREFQDKADIQLILDRFPNLDWELVKSYADLFGEWQFVETLRNRK